MSFEVITQVQTDSAGDWIVLHDTGAGSVAVIAPARGGLVRSFSVEGRELLYQDEATFADPAKNVRGGVPVLFPAPGRLRDDSWQHAGRRCEMKQHGFARNEVWSEVERNAVDAASVVLCLRSHAGLQAQFPLRFEARLGIELRGAVLRIRFELTNLDEGAMPYALGFHPYFAVSDKASATIHTQASTAYNNRTKALERFTGFDLTADELDLHLQDHGSDHCDVSFADGSGVRVRASDAFRRWVVWTLRDKPFVCVEPWTAGADALNTGELLLQLPAHETAVHSIEIEALPAR